MTHSAHLQQQEGHECGRNTSHCDGSKCTTKPSREAHASQTGLTRKDTGTQCCNTSPEGALTKVIGMPALGPQTAGKELLVVLLLLFFLKPIALLLIGSRLERNAANKKHDPDDIGNANSRQCCENRSWQSVYRQDGQQAQSHPSGLSCKCTQELGR